MSTTIYVRTAASESPENDASFEFDIGETLHLQTGAKLSVFKLPCGRRLPQSTDRGQYLYWHRRGPAEPSTGRCLPDRSLHGDAAGRLDQQQLRLRPPMWNETNEIQECVGDGNRRHPQRLRRSEDLFPGTGSYPAGATPSKPL